MPPGKLLRLITFIKIMSKKKNNPSYKIKDSDYQSIADKFSTMYQEDVERVGRGEPARFFGQLNDKPLENVNPEFDLLFSPVKGLGSAAKAGSSYGISSEAVGRAGSILKEIGTGVLRWDDILRNGTRMMVDEVGKRLSGKAKDFWDKYPGGLIKAFVGRNATNMLPGMIGLDSEDNGSVSFQEAFKEASDQGLGEFEWNGKVYTTDKKKNGGVIGLKLSESDEKKFKDWYGRLSEYKGLNPDPDDANQYYDYRGFWKENPELAERMLNDDPDAHFVDTYKLPGHPTFSNESKYGGRELGGEWVIGDDGREYYKPSPYTSSYIDRTIDYLSGTGEGIIYNGEYIMPDRIPYKMENGGDVKDPEEDRMRKYYQDRRDEMRAKAWINNWLSNRTDILGRNVVDSRLDKFGDFFRSYESIGDRERKSQSSYRSAFKNYTYGSTIDGIPEYVLNAFNAGYLDKDKIDDYSLSLLYRLQGSRGATAPSIGSIFYPEYPDMNTRIHENSHAGENRKLFSRFNPQTYVISERKDDRYLLDGVDYDRYGDSSNEIYARLNEFRYLNNIDPKKKYTKEDVLKMRKDKDVKDRDLLNRYNDDFILFLLNDVAMNDNTKDGVLYGKDGGLVEKQDYIYNRLTSEYDIPPMQAAAIVANLTHESGLQTGALGDSGASYGIQQWRDERRKNLNQFAKERGHVEPTMDDQIDYLMYEYNNGRAFQFSTRGQNLYQTGKSKNKTFDYYQFSKSDFDNAASLRDAVIAWNQGVGRPNKEFAMNDRRYKIAAEIAYRHGIKDGEKNYYNDMGYLPDGEMTGIHLPEVNIVANQPEQIPVEEQKKTDYYNTYGRQIVSQMMSFNPESQSTPTSQDVSKESDKMDQDAVRISKAIAENEEAEKRKMLIEAFLPNIQLAVKGVTQVGK